MGQTKALIDNPKIGESYFQHLNQADREHFVFAVNGDRYVAEYRMPAGNVYMRLGNTSTGVEDAVSLKRLPSWARELHAQLDEDRFDEDYDTNDRYPDEVPAWRQAAVDKLEQAGASETDVLLRRLTAFADLADLNRSVNAPHAYRPTIRGDVGPDYARLRVLLIEDGIRVFPDPTAAELANRTSTDALRPAPFDPRPVPQLPRELRD